MDEQEQQLRERVRNSALASLTRREHSRTELGRKLASKQHPPELIDETLHWLEELGYVDDERFVQVFIRASLGSGKGPVRISHELRQKGIASGHIESALAGADVDWFELARELLLKKYGEPAREGKEKAKQIRYLQYRGFQPDHIFCLFDR